MNSESPRAPAFGSGLVRARSASTLARPAKVHHAFAPVRYQPPSPRSARQRIEATSEPVSGSVTEMPTISSPDAIGGSHFRFWASVPPLSSALVRISGRVNRLPAEASEEPERSAE